jgi:hypothetical protein
LVSQVFELAPAGTLKSGERQRFEFKFPVPITAHPSLKLTHNEILWASEFRVDIPKWPDWIKEIPFVVKPTKQLQSSREPVSHTPSPNNDTSTKTNTTSSEEDRWLTQVLQQVLQSDGDTERLDDVLDAIENQTFQVTLDLQEESDELTPTISGQAELEEYGTWLHAMDVQRNIKVALYVSGAGELETLEWRKNWKGEVAIVGLNSLSQRVLMKSIAPSR